MLFVTPLLLIYPHPATCFPERNSVYHYTKENTLALRHDFPYVSRHTKPKIEPPAVKTSTVWGKWENPLEKQTKGMVPVFIIEEI